ncbi:hypothetical protein FE810_16940 [Thalassotalea litorea]|uniref:Uncharacterized protein n=1 Tax=Thalassotalea litorea TaxID=2020715 RepID=A0A5R9IE48_9GAMM|nr:hypothetical protein [Thalassotalea litorea]TLU59464.1 hypothetical protein FE810_16940 [Thalassotalea litorea]
MRISTRNGYHLLTLGAFTKSFVPALSQLLETEYDFKTHDRPSAGTNIISWDMSNGNFFISISWKAIEDVSGYSNPQAKGEVNIVTNCDDGLNFLEKLKSELPNKLRNNTFASFCI